MYLLSYGQELIMYYLLSKPGEDTNKKDKSGGKKYGNVAFHASRISRSYYQAVVIDKANNVQDAIDVAYKAYDSIIARNIGQDQYRFYVWVETSGTGPPSVWKT